MSKHAPACPAARGGYPCTCGHRESPAPAEETAGALAEFGAKLAASQVALSPEDAAILRQVPYESAEETAQEGRAIPYAAPGETLDESIERIVRRPGVRFPPAAEGERPDLDDLLSEAQRVLRDGYHDHLSRAIAEARNRYTLAAPGLETRLDEMRLVAAAAFDEGVRFTRELLRAVVVIQPEARQACIRRALDVARETK